MTNAEKKQLFTKLYQQAAQKHGHGWKTRFANSLRVKNRTVLNWLDPAQGWTSADQEAEIWKYFGWTLNARGDPEPEAEQDAPAQPGLLDFDEILANLDALEATLRAFRSQLEQRKPTH
jgi:hypothetical protein